MIDGKRNRPCIVLLCALCLPAMSQAVVVSLNPPHAAFGAESQQTVHVMVDHVDALRRGSLTLAYDPAVVAVVDVAPGYLVTDAGCPWNFAWQPSVDHPDAVVMDVVMDGCDAVGSGVFLAITFQGIAGGTCALTFLAADLRGPDDAPLPVELQNGAITYAPVTPALLTFATADVHFYADHTAEFCIDLTGATDFHAASLVFGFDPAILAPVAVEPGAALAALGCLPYVRWTNHDQWYDTMAIDIAMDGCSGPVSGPLVCVTVAGVGPGDSPLYWMAADFYDGADTRFPVIVEDSSLTYQPVIASEAASLSQVKAAFR